MEQLGLSGSNPGDLKARLSAGPGEFASILSSIQEAARVRFVSSDEQSNSPAPTLVLPVDQAEELFNADAGPEVRKFLNLISEVLGAALGPAGASSPAVSLIVAFTIRSDRYEPLQTASELAGLQTTVFDDLKPMSTTRFREVITGPVKRASTAAGRLEIKPDLVDRLVEDCATGADPLPLLSLTLQRLYHDFGGDGDLRLDEYLALGGMGNIIKDKIEKVLDPDPLKRKQQLALLRTAFIPWLVTINPENDEPMRKLARRSDLPEDSLPLVDALVENRRSYATSGIVRR
jgi:conflict system STAND superfamily ATPase